ncbi:MAG TPA: nickel pincer cofactor biosynthesis protein LarC [Candidatus Acidoferrales bacterium]|nr:nickel pincer cofactor biosynthesis protein LarC [Candidatus Acidoferrales bacterium]
MKLAYFDCFSGISGDMVLGALVDAGCPLPEIEAGLRKLELRGWKISGDRVKRAGIAATKISVETEETHHHRGFSLIANKIEKAGLAPRAAERAIAIFRHLGESEARIHGVDLEKVHFHEVGAADSIVDIVGSAIGFEILGIERFACSALNFGGGTVQAAHGTMPVPAPATADLLRGKPTYSSGIQKELVTPTGAAIVSTLCDSFGSHPAMMSSAIGYGAGAADFKEHANVLRITIGESLEQHTSAWDERITVIEANLDDMNPQIYGYFAEKALAAGALDVFAAPVQMKKNRPGMLVTLLCAPNDADRLADLLFSETTTIGLRSYEARRRVLARESVEVTTPHGPVKMKVARLNGHVLNAAPEFDDCRRIATEKNVPLKQILAEAALAWENQRRGQR